MINLFGFASQDQSLLYLFNIFGSMNGIIVPPGGSTANTYAILGAMFKVFNSVVLAVGALIILYVTVMSVVMTAHEGEFMGKKWNNIWIFVRIVFAIALMVPTASGYCAIQYIMMWCIVQGIGAADKIWSAALDYINIYGSIYAQPTVPTTGTAPNFQGLFAGLVCDASARFTQQDPTGTDHGNYYCASTNNSFCTQPLPQPTPTQTSISFGPNGSCGSLTYCNSAQVCGGSNANSMACSVCNAQIQALSAAITTMAGIATQFVQADYSYRLFYANSGTNQNTSQWPFIGEYCSQSGISPDACCVPPVSKMALALPQTCSQNSNFESPNDNKRPQNLNPNVVTNIIWPYALSSISNPQGGGGGTNFIDVLVNDAYTKSLTNAVTVNSNTTAKPLSGTLQTAASYGWITAGSFYYTIAQMNDKNAQGAVPTMTWNPASPSPVETGNVMYGYRNNYSAAQSLISSAAGTSGTSSNPQVSQSLSTMSTAMGDISTAFDNSSGQSSAGQGGSSNTQLQGSGSNPLASLQSLGRAFLISAEVLFSVLLIGSLIAGLLGNLGDIFVLGNGMINPVGPALMLVYMLLVPIMIGLLAILVTYGGLLAVYAPLIPYIIWVTAVIAWFITVIEAMVAGPLVALGMLSPNTQGHEILGKAEPALGHLFSIFLRPTLMVFGLIAAMLLASAVISMINSGFVTVRQSTGYIGTADPLGLILFFGAYIGLCIAAISKCFQLIYLIPQQVLTWIGLRHEAHADAADMLGQAKETSAGVGRYAAGGMEAGVGPKGTAYQGGSSAAGVRKQQTESQQAPSATATVKGAKGKGET